MLGRTGTTTVEEVEVVVVVVVAAVEPELRACWLCSKRECRQRRPTACWAQSAGMRQGRRSCSHTAPKLMSMAATLFPPTA